MNSSTLTLRPVLRDGQPRGPQPLARHPRPLCRTDRPAAALRAPPDRRWTALRKACATSSPRAGAAATSPCPSSSRPRPWPRVCSERVRLAGAANMLSFAADGSIQADNTDGLGLVADITRNAGVPLQGARRAAGGRRRCRRWRAGPAAAGRRAPHHHVPTAPWPRPQALVASHSALAALQKAELLALDSTSARGAISM